MRMRLFSSCAAASVMRFVEWTKLKEKDPLPEETAASSASKYARLGSHAYGTTRRRWLVLALYCAVAMLWSAYQFTYMALADTVVPLFEVQSEQEFAWLVQLASFCPIPFGFVVADTLHRWGLRATLLIGVLLQILGGWIRVMGACAGRTCFRASYVGQATAAIGSVFLGPAVIGMLSTCWFAPQERARVIATAQVFNTIGSAVVLVIGPYMPGADPVHQLLHVTVLEAALATLGGIALVYFCRDYPPAPDGRGVRFPSPAAALTHDTVSQPPAYRVAWHLLRQRSYVLMLAMYAVGMAALANVPDVLQTVMTSAPLHYSTDDAGVCTLLYLFCGVLGALVCGWIGDRTGLFVFPTAVLGLLTTFFLALLAGTLAPDRYNAAAAFSALTGFAGLAFMPVSIELLAELCFPWPVGVATALLVVGGAVLQLSVAAVARAAQSLVRPQAPLWVLFGVWCAIFVLAPFYRQIMRRRAFEREVDRRMHADAAESGASAEAGAGDEGSSGVPAAGPCGSSREPKDGDDVALTVAVAESSVTDVERQRLLPA